MASTARVDPRSPCLIGVSTDTWHKQAVGDAGAPEPLIMWDSVARAAADDSCVGQRVLAKIDAMPSVASVNRFRLIPAYAGSVPIVVLAHTFEPGKPVRFERRAIARVRYQPCCVDVSGAESAQHAIERIERGVEAALIDAKWAEGGSSLELLLLRVIVSGAISPLRDRRACIHRQANSFAAAGP